MASRLDSLCPFFCCSILLNDCSISSVYRKKQIHQYVDLEYEGGGIGEYMYWNRETNDWDDTACRHGQSNSNNNNNRNNRNNKNNNKNNNDNDGYYDSRCAKMDCHLSSTHFKLLGFFKHKSYDDWMEQLFKHEGMCVWSDDEYSFMKNARKAWPSGCTVSQVQTTSDNGQQQQIYYDLKPTTGGGITLGLYTDTKCIVEYVSWGSNDPITVENVAGNILANSGGGSHDNNNNDNANSDYTFKQSLQMWDQSFDAFKVCQPCVAHDLNNYGYNTDDDASHGSSYGSYRYGYDDDYKWYYYGQNKGSDFDCYDDAGYTNVNQVRFKK